MSLKEIRIADEHWRRMRAHVATEAPLEACGLLAGEGNASQAVFPIRNEAESATRFLMDAKEQVDAFIEIEAAGWQLLAIFHSHPAGPAGPSRTDLAEALYPDTLQLIWSRGAGGEWTCRAFRYEQEHAVAIDIKREETVT